MADYLRWHGVTLDLTYEIQSVSAPPAEPATPVSPAPTGDNEEDE
jgi:hypothetical protein